MDAFECFPAGWGGLRGVKVIIVAPYVLFWKLTDFPPI